MGGVRRLFVLFFLASATAALLGSNSYLLAPRDLRADWDAVSSLISCGQRYDLASELAVPGVVSGYDCYSSNAEFQVAFRESQDSLSLKAALATWHSLGGLSLFKLEGNGWFVVVSSGNRNQLAAYDPYYENAFIRLPDIRNEVVDSSLRNGAVECSQFSEAIIYAYVVDRVGLPKNLSNVAEEIIVRGYSDLLEDPDFQSLGEGSPALRAVLNNRAAEINGYCATGGEIYESRDG